MASLHSKNGLRYHMTMSLCLSQSRCLVSICSVSKCLLRWESGVAVGGIGGSFWTANKMKFLQWGTCILIRKETVYKQEKYQIVMSAVLTVKVGWCAVCKLGCDGVAVLRKGSDKAEIRVTGRSQSREDQGEARFRSRKQKVQKL